MARAVKAVTTYRGRDPRDFSLLAFGGNGPIFAAALAESLGMRHVRVPAAAGVFSALGLIEAEETWHLGRSVFEEGATLRGDDLTAGYQDLERQLAAELSERGAADATIAWGADVRYAGQGYEIPVPAERGTPARDLVGRLRDAFHEAHARSYGHAAPGDEIELVNLKVTGSLPRASSIARATAPYTPARTAREVWFGSAGGRQTVPVVGRSDVREGVRGPLLIEEFDTTTVVPPGWTATLDEQHTIVLEHDA
jgi:N-methylhydantoinase A